MDLYSFSILGMFFFQLREYMESSNQPFQEQHRHMISPLIPEVNF